jgi:hypothetical protein
VVDEAAKSRGNTGTPRGVWGGVRWGWDLLSPMKSSGTGPDELY